MQEPIERSHLLMAHIQDTSNCGHTHVSHRSVHLWPYALILGAALGFLAGCNI